ncbi:TetR/AcrR family transcriptional regulator [Desulfosarcina ovata]|uniref:TetR/AcrR family transcriptional regulator n=1 Tax=Desulfosarcina ovata TaxID=83564 RepID=UPI0012D2C71C
MSTKPRQRDTKTDLINVAIDISHAKGFQKTRVSDIVTAANVAQGTFYLYFKSKDDIFLNICTEFKFHFTTACSTSSN